jgi:hypothetical protein
VRHVLFDMSNNKIKISGFDYSSLSYLDKWYQDDIPESEGIYSWVFYPEFDPKEITTDELMETLLSYTKTRISTQESTTKFKFEVTIDDSWYGARESIFGLSSKSEKQLRLYLAEEGNKIHFHDFFKHLCFLKPFYVGKALNLKQRIGQHIRYKSEIRDTVDSLDISTSQIWIGYREIALKTNENISKIYEEILQRTIKPGLTKRPG